jgi:hypothetical protein
MLKFIPISLLLLLAGQVSAQTCVRDSTIFGTAQLVSPKQWTPADPTIYTLPACINEPYLQPVTFNVPNTFVFNATSIPLTKIAVAATGAVTGLPAGLSYSCDPPNCEFLANTLGCMLISGTPTPNNTPGDKELSIALKVFSILTIDINFPGQLAPNDKYYITVKNPGECVSGTSDLSGQIASVKTAPNPFAQQTEIMVNALVTGEFTFEVFNLVGKRVNEQTIQLVEGANSFTFDAGNLPNGTYFYSLGNRTGRATNTFVINR